MSERNASVVPGNSTAIGIELKRAFARVARNEVQDPQQVHDAVCAYVDAVKHEGWPVERAIIALKEIAASAGVRVGRHLRLVPESGPAVSVPPEVPAEELVADSVRWCIEHYYGREMG